MSETSQEWRGKVGGMSEEERDAFLERGVVCASRVSMPRGGPYVVPCWHEWREGAFWVVPRQRSVWAEHLKRERRGLLHRRRPGDAREGDRQGRRRSSSRSANVGGEWVEVATRMSVRYLGPERPDVPRADARPAALAVQDHAGVARRPGRASAGRGATGSRTPAGRRSSRRTGSSAGATRQHVPG